MSEGKMSLQGSVLNRIALERIRQDQKWGEQNHSPAWWMVILMEEVGEAARAVFEVGEHGKVANHYIEEMTQVAAVAVAALENILRQINGEGETIEQRCERLGRHVCGPKDSVGEGDDAD